LHKVDTKFVAVLEDNGLFTRHCHCLPCTKVVLYALGLLLSKLLNVRFQSDSSST